MFQVIDITYPDWTLYWGTSADCSAYIENDEHSEDLKIVPYEEE